MSGGVDILPIDALRFRFQANKQLLENITITNQGAQRVAFNVKTNAPKTYVVRPSSGAVEPGSHTVVRVIRQAEPMYTPALANCADKLMVQTTTLAEGEPVDRDTFSGSSGGGGGGGRDPQREVRDHRLRVVVMEGVEALSSSVGEAQAWYEEQMAELSQEVESLKAKLGSIHSTDTNSLRRAYKSLAQHVEALDVESRHLPALLGRATEEAVTPEFVAGEVKVVAVAAAAVYGVGRLLQAARVKNAAPISLGLALVGAGVVTVKVVAATAGRVAAVALRRRTAQQELRRDVDAVMERIKIMTDLADSGLRLHGLHPQQQQQQQPEGALQQESGVLPQAAADSAEYVSASTSALTS